MRAIWGLRPGCSNHQSAAYSQHTLKQLPQGEYRKFAGPHLCGPLQLGTPPRHQPCTTHAALVCGQQELCIIMAHGEARACTSIRRWTPLKPLTLHHCCSHEAVLLRFSAENTEPLTGRHLRTAWARCGAHILVGLSLGRCCGAFFSAISCVTHDTIHQRHQRGKS